MERLEILAGRMRWLIGGILLAAPLIFAAMVATGGLAGLLPLPLGTEPDLSAVGPLGFAAVTAVAALKPAAFLVAFGFLYRLFGLYRRGLVFEAENVACLSRIGWSLVAVDVVAAVQQALTGPVLTAFGATQGFVSIGLGLSYAVIGFFLLVLARVMDLGRVLKEQDALTI